MSNFSVNQTVIAVSIMCSIREILFVFIEVKELQLCTATLPDSLPWFLHKFQLLQNVVSVHSMMYSIYCRCYNLVWEREVSFSNVIRAAFKLHFI